MKKLLASALVISVLTISGFSSTSMAHDGSEYTTNDEITMKLREHNRNTKKKSFLEWLFGTASSSSSSSTYSPSSKKSFGQRAYESHSRGGGPKW